MQYFPIIEKLGGRGAVFERLKKAGHAIGTADAIRMWPVRGQIPGDATRRLMEFAEADKIDYQAEDFALSSEPAA